ncbi:MAG: hypothetical protein FJY51_07690 [Betaproteobacteria bacterium]|nr:hypothetical protein [Betaproteobacteria bacterium]
MAAEIRKGLGVDPVLAKGAGGVFDVACDGRLVFSKHRDPRFPGAAEIIAAIRAL